MPLSRTEVSAGLADELSRFERVIRPLTPAEWATPTRCAGWTVADVAAHVAGTMTNVTIGKYDDFGSPEGLQRLVDARRGRTAEEVADELAGSSKVAADLLGALTDEAWELPSPGDLGFSIGFGVEALWYDAYVHIDDVNAALGRPTERSPGLRASVSHVAGILTNQGWGPATLRLDGVDGEWPVSGGGGRAVTGDAHEFVLVATGRRDPATFGLDQTVNVYREQ